MLEQLLVRDKIAPSLNSKIVSLPRSRVVPPHRPQTTSSYQKSQKKLDRDENVPEAIINDVERDGTRTRADFSTST
jgi:hypothetical protein